MIRRTFRHDFDPSLYIRGKIASETVNPDAAEPFQTSYGYDDQGFLTSKTVYGITTTYERDDFGNLWKKTDADGKWAKYWYAWGRVSKIQTPLYVVQRGINEDGTIASEARDSADGHFNRKTSFTYDELGRETSRTPPLGLATSMNYDHEGDAPDPHVEVTRGTTWTKNYLDGYGRTVRTVNNGGLTTTTHFDAWGRKEFESYPFTDTQVGTSYAYDALDRVTTKTEADGKQTAFGYGSDSNGLTVTITEPFKIAETRTTVQTWAATGDPDDRRLIRVTDAEGKQTSYEYNAIDKLTGVQSPGIGARTYEYFLGTDRLWKETHPETGNTTYDYHLNGKLKSRTDALSNTLTYAYDNVNRLVSVVSSAEPAYTLTLTYDDPWSDNRATVTNGYVASAFGYDNAGRLVSRTDTINAGMGGVSRTFTTTYVPNDYDNVASVTYPSGRAVSYGFDALQRIQSVADGTRTYGSDISYHPSGQVTGYTSGNGVTNTFSYDPATYRPSAITHAKGDQTLLSLGYSYYDEGNVKAISDTRSGMSQDFTDGYDKVDRLVAAAGPWGSRAFTYDAVGNRKTEVRDGVTTTYTYDPVPEVASNVLTSISGGQTESFTPNKVGQTVADGRGSYTYTPTGLMATATLNGMTATHRYDGDDLRVVKVKEGVTHYYVHGLGGQLLSEYEEGGGQEPAWTVDYVYAGSRLVAAVRPPGPQHLTTVTLGGTGQGAVMITSPTQIDCRNGCSVDFPYGTVVTLSATPAGGWQFAHWDGACTGGAPTATVTMSEGRTCTANYTNITDFNTDGHADLVWRHLVTGDDVFWYMNGAARIGAPAPFDRLTPTTWEIAAIGDLDGDGKADLVWRDTVAGTNTVWFMDGPTMLAWAYLPAAPVTTWHIVGAADWNSDGKVDLVWQDSVTGTTTLWYMSGATLVSWEYIDTSEVTDRRWRIVATRDFNGDGKPDLVWRHSATGTAVVWYMDGLARTGLWASLDSVPDTQWELAAVHDFNGDGKPDLVWRNYTTGTTTVWYMNGTTMADWAPLETVADTNWVIAGTIRLADGGGGGGLVAVHSYTDWPAGRRRAPVAGLPPTAKASTDHAHITQAGWRSAGDQAAGGVAGALELGISSGPHVTQSEEGSTGWSPAMVPPTNPATEVAEYYHLDALGSVRVVTDADGAVLRYHDYLPFGDEWQPSFPPKDLRLFTGKERDFETGLDYFGGRYYRADLGRFTSVDPVQTWTENFVDPQRWNRYAYALNNPLRYDDEQGWDARDRVNAARRFAETRVPYARGGGHRDRAPENGLDCSGLVIQVLKADPDNLVPIGDPNVQGLYDLFATSSDAEFSKEVGEVKPGDVIFWSLRGRIGHVGVVVDIKDGRLYWVDAPGENRMVLERAAANKKGDLGSGWVFAAAGRPRETPSRQAEKARNAKGSWWRVMLGWLFFPV